MKLKCSKFQINFWFIMTIVIALAWYLLFTPRGAVRRELIGKQWLVAVGGKIEVVENNKMGSSNIYTTNPKTKDEEGKSYYYTCHKKNIFLKCRRINY